MLTIATYFWKDPKWPHKNPYTVDDVRRLQRQVKKNLEVEHEFAVITTEWQDFENEPNIKPIPLDRTTHVPGTCFTRLFTFHPRGAEIFGERMLVMDLDTLVVGDMSPIVNRTADIVVWRNPTRVPWTVSGNQSRPYYNTSLVMHKCGSMPELFTDFDPANPGCRDDQWWVSKKVGPVAHYWDRSHGVYRLARVNEPKTGVWGELPKNAKIVTFPGSEGKWTEPHIAEANPWIKDYI